MKLFKVKFLSTLQYDKKIYNANSEEVFKMEELSQELVNLKSFNLIELEEIEEVEDKTLVEVNKSKRKR